MLLSPVSPPEAATPPVLPQLPTHTDVHDDTLSGGVCGGHLHRRRPTVSSLCDVDHPLLQEDSPRASPSDTGTNFSSSSRLGSQPSLLCPLVPPTLVPATAASLAPPLGCVRLAMGTPSGLRWRVTAAAGDWLLPPSPSSGPGRVAAGPGGEEPLRRWLSASATSSCPPASTGALITPSAHVWGGSFFSLLPAGAPLTFKGLNCNSDIRGFAAYVCFYCNV